MRLRARTHARRADRADRGGPDDARQRRAPRRTGRRAGRVLVPVALAALTLAGAPVASATTSVGPDFEMPFPCGDTWTGSSRPTHSPSPLSIDWSRYNDYGAPVVSAAPGVVTAVVNLGTVSYGRYIVVDHGDGTSTLYAHLSAQWVTVGQAVDQGTPLGLVGSTGGSTGPHLHFEERLNRVDQPSYFHRVPFVMGSTQSSQNCGDVPVTGDWDGNGGANIGSFRRSAVPTFVLKRPHSTPLTITYGAPSDQPVSGDWDGDGTIDVGVRRASTSSFYLRHADGTTTRIALGSVGDVGVTGDWEGDGTTNVGVWHPSTQEWTIRMADATTRSISFGSLGDVPVTGDWDGDGNTDLGVYSPSTATFRLRTVTPSGVVTYHLLPWGTASSIPVTGDWNHDGLTDIGVWDPATATYQLRVTPALSTPVSGSAVTRRPVWGVPRG